jgi:hypothetical protein
MSDRIAYVLSKHAANVVVERAIDLAWLEAALSAPGRTEPDRADDQLTHALKRIDAAEGRVLRVVYNHVQTPIKIVTMYFDRSMRGQL